MAAAPGHSAPPPTCTSLTEGPAAPGTVSARVPARGRGPRASFPLPVARPALPATPLRRQRVASGVDFCAAGHRRHFPTGEPARSARRGAHLGLWLQLRATSRPRSQIGSLALTSVSTADEGACLHPDAHRSLQQHCPDRALSDLGGARSSGTPARRRLPRAHPSQRLAVVLAPSLPPSHLLPPAPVTCAVSYVRAAALLSCLLPLPGLDFADTRRPWTSHRPPGVISRPFYKAIGEVHGTQAPCAQRGSASAGPAQSASWGPAAPLGSRLLLTAGTVRGPSPLPHLRGPLGPCNSDPRIMLIRKVTFT